MIFQNNLEGSLYLCVTPSFLTSNGNTGFKMLCLQTINAGEGVEKRESSCAVAGQCIVGTATMKNAMEVPRKTRNRIAA